MKAVIFTTLVASLSLAGPASAQTPAPVAPARAPQTKDMATLQAWIATLQTKTSDGTWVVLDSNDTGVRLAMPQAESNQDDIRNLNLRLERFLPEAGEKGPVLSEYFEISFNCYRHTRTENTHQTFAEQNMKGARRNVTKLDRNVADEGPWRDLEDQICKSKVVKRAGSAG